MTSHPTRPATPIDCDCATTRPHGTTHTYQKHKCGCDDCRSHNTRMVTAYRKRRILQGDRTIPADQTRTHLNGLRGAGWSLRLISDHTGIAPTTLQRISSGKTSRATPRIATPILHVPMQSPDDGLVSSTGARDRVRALMWTGWTRADIAAASGVKEATVNRVARSEAGHRITVRSDTALRATYRRMHTQTPRGPQAAANRTKARQVGYQPPGSWEDTQEAA